MIEQALYFAIGFLVAALAAVVGLPFVSRRAMRLAEARARLQAPATEREAIAERDALRAQYAVDAMRLERRATGAEQSATSMRAALGEKSVRILALEEGLAERLRAAEEQQEEIERLSSEGRGLGAELGAVRIALNDAFAQRDKASDAEAAALTRQGELEAEASRDRARIAILLARAESLGTAGEEMARSAKASSDADGSLAQSLAAETARAEQLERRLQEAASRSEAFLEARTKGEAAQEKSRKRIAELEARLAASEHSREETLLENGRQLAAIAERDAQLETARAESAALKTRLAAPPADTLAGPEAMQRENEALRAEVAALTAEARRPIDDTALREAIKRLGREVGRVFAAQKAARATAAGPALDSADRDAPAKPPSDERQGLAETASPRLARSRATER